MSEKAIRAIIKAVRASSKAAKDGGPGSGPHPGHAAGSSVKIHNPGRIDHGKQAVVRGPDNSKQGHSIVSYGKKAYSHPNENLHK